MIEEGTEYWSHPGDVIPEDVKGSHEWTDEPTWWLRGLRYDVYLQSEHWRRVRREFLERAEREGRRCCWRCGIKEIDWVVVTYSWYANINGKRCKANSRLYPQEHKVIRWEPRLARLEVHHQTYENVGCEGDEDLELLCHPCHNLHHKPLTNAALAWAYYINHGGPYPYGQGRNPGSPSSVEGEDDGGDLSLDVEPVIPGMDLAEWGEEDE